MNDIGFIIVRHVENEFQDRYWKECYTSIRKFHTDKKIVIIDNNSDYKFIDSTFKMINCEVINSEIPESRFFAPFYYLLTNKFDFEIGIILHDGIIFTDYMRFDDINESKFLWHFSTKQEQNNILRLISKLENSNLLLNTYKNNDWVGSLGGMGVFNISFLKTLEKIYKITNLKTEIISNVDAMDWERLIGVIMCTNSKLIKNNYSYMNECVDINNNITNNINWAYSFEQYLNDKISCNLQKPIVKIFGRRVL